MKNRLLIVSTLMIAIVLRLTSISVIAQSGGDYELTWTSIDAGGGSMNGGAYSLVSTVGQPEPGATQSGGVYSLNGGVVDAGGSVMTQAGDQQIFLPLIWR